MINQRLLILSIFVPIKRLSGLPVLYTPSEKIRIALHILVDGLRHALVLFVIATAEKHTANVFVIEISHLIAGDPFWILTLFQLKR